MGWGMTMNKNNLPQIFAYSGPINQYLINLCFYIPISWSWSAHNYLSGLEVSRGSLQRKLKRFFDPGFSA